MADRILAGAVDEDGVPDGLAGVVPLLRAARRAQAVGDPARRDATLAAMAAAASSPDGLGAVRALPHRGLGWSRRLRLATGAGLGAVTLFGGLTAAAALSGGVADAVHDATGVRLPLSAQPHEPASPAPSAGSGTDKGTTGHATSGSSGANGSAACAGAGHKDTCPAESETDKAKARGGETEGRGRGGDAGNTAATTGSGGADTSGSSDRGGPPAGGNPGDKGGGGGNGGGSGSRGTPGDGHAKNAGGSPGSPGSPNGPGSPNNSDSGHKGATSSGSPSDLTRPHGNQELP